MKRRDMLNYIISSQGSGVSFGDISRRFEDEETGDIQRLLEALVLDSEVKKDGKGRGTKYYHIDVEIIKIIETTNGVIKIADPSILIDGIIDVSHCNTTQEKIDAVLQSDKPLNNPCSFEYRKKIFPNQSFSELKQFLLGGVEDVCVKIIYDNLKRKNIIYSTKSKKNHNSIFITLNNNNEIEMHRLINGSFSNPEKTVFTKYEEFEKCIKTLIAKK